MTADPKPSPEALEAEAIAHDLALRFCGQYERAKQEIKLTLVRFRAAGVEAERSRVAEAINTVRDANTIKGRSYSACWMNACTEIETLLREGQP